MEKNIAIIVAGAQGSSEIKDLSIKPGTAARDILGTLGLDGYVISKADGKFFNPQDNVYERVEDGEKLYATTAAEVG